MRPDHAAIWIQFGHALKESGRLDEALGAYEEAANLQGDHADLLLSLGHIHKLRGDAARAATYYEKSARLDNNAAAHDELRRISASAAFALTPLAPPAPAAAPPPPAPRAAQAIAPLAVQAPEPTRPPVLLSDLSLESLSSAEALIERTGRPRILLDAADLMQNTTLVDAFLAADGLDVDVWCLFPGTLKPWMRPALLIEDVPAAELGLYYASVDVAVMTHVDVGFNARVFACLACGAIPVAATVEARAALAATGAITGSLQPQDSPLRDILVAMTMDPARLVELRQAARAAASAFKSAVLG
jgi:tetratricopeptide (TPR) repeat protein